MESITRKMVHEVRTYDTDEIEELIKACGESDSFAQQEARLALENIGEAAVDPVIQALLHSENPIIRWRAAEALGHVPYARAIEPLIQALGDKDTSVQWRAIDALTDIGGPALELLYLASEDENVEIRWGATRAIKDIKSKLTMEENDRLYEKMRNMNDNKDEVVEMQMCKVCKKEPAVNYDYCIECSGRRGFS